MTYTKDMYGMPSSKPGRRGGWYQASNKPPGALAAQCALEKSAGDVYAWREEEICARADDIKREMARNPGQKSGPTTRKVLRGVGLGSLVDREDESAYVKALRSMPNYEPLDEKQRARLYEATHYPFHTEESARAFEEDRARRQEQRDKAAAYRYFDDAASRSEYEGTLDRKFETLPERESRILHFRHKEFERVVGPLEAKYLAIRDSGVDTASAEYRQMREQLLAVVESLDGPALFAALARENDPDPYDLAGSSCLISSDYHLRGRLEDFDMYTKPQYIHYCPMEAKEQEINLFKDIFARYHEGERLSDHELKLYALALEYELDEHDALRQDIVSEFPNIIETLPRSFSISPRQPPQKTSDAPSCDNVDTFCEEKSPEKVAAKAVDTCCAIDPSSDSDDTSSDEPPEKAITTPVSRHKIILCFEVRRSLGNEFEAMCRNTDLEERHARIRRRIIAAQNKHKFKLKDWRRLLPKTSVREISREGFPMHSSMPSSKVEEMTMDDHGINFKSLPLISPEKDKSPMVAEDGFHFEENGRTAESDFKTVSPAKDNALQTGEQAGDDYSFDKEKTSGIDVDYVSPIIDNVLETLKAASIDEGKHSGKAVED